MFAGAWELLTACAPYILAAVIIIIIAINMAKKNQLDNFIWLLGILESQQEPDVCFARISGDSLEIMIFGDEIVTELKNIPEKETQTLVVYGVDKIGIPQLQKKWTGQEIQVRGIIDEYNGKTYFKLQAYNQKTLEWINLGNISDKYQPYFLPGQSKRMKIYSISMNAQGKTKRAALFNKDMSQEEIDKCLIFDLSATTK